MDLFILLPAVFLCKKIPWDEKAAKREIYLDAKDKGKEIPFFMTNNKIIIKEDLTTSEKAMNIEYFSLGKEDTEKIMINKIRTYIYVKFANKIVVFKIFDSLG